MASQGAVASGDAIHQAYFAGLAAADLVLSVTSPALIADGVGEVMARRAGVGDEMVSLILRDRCRRS